MNLLTPVADIMTTDLLTVRPDDSLERVRDIFLQHNIHHIPVVEQRTLVGIVSSTDFQQFMRGFTSSEVDTILQATRLKAWRVEEIMTSKLAKVESTDPVRTVADVFLENRIHALPVVDAGRLVGIVTTYDLIKLLASEPVRLSDYKSATDQ